MNDSEIKEFDDIWLRWFGSIPELEDGEYDAIKSFISTLLARRTEETKSKVLMDVANAFGRYYPISGTDLDDLDKLADEFVKGVVAGEMEGVVKICEGMKKGCNNEICKDPNCLLRTYNIAITDIIKEIKEKWL
jgi:hypothetical protein